MYRVLFQAQAVLTNALVEASMAGGWLRYVDFSYLL
jgi:hypothetical protein